MNETKRGRKPGSKPAPGLDVGGRPTHYGAPMRRVNVMLDPKTLAVLDRIADNRSAAIRTLAAKEIKMQYELTIKQASELAYKEDAYQIVGKKGDEWVIRAWEDPESSMLEDSVKVSGDGVDPDYAEQHAENLAA